MALIAPQNFKTKTRIVFVIRNAQAADAVAVLDLNRKVMRENVYTIVQADEFTISEAQQVERIHKFNQEAASLLIIATLDEKVVASLDFSPGTRKRTAHSGSFAIAVAKECRELGIGRALIEVLENWARAHPVIEKVCLGVHSTNDRAIHLYKKLGYLEEGRRSKDLKYGPNEYVDTILMAKFVK